MKAKQKPQLVPAEAIKELMWGYLYHKRALSQRQLAQIVSQKSKKLGSALSSEAAQRIFSKTVRQAPKILQTTLIALYRELGFADEKSVWRDAKKHAQESRELAASVSASEAHQLVWLYFSRGHGASKRVLAQMLKAKLDLAGYDYNLGSLQNLFSGKIGETRLAVVQILKDLICDQVFSGNKSELIQALKNVPEEGKTPIAKAPGQPREISISRRPNLDRIYQRLSQVSDPRQHAELEETFYDMRTDALKRLWAKRAAKAERKLQSKNQKPVHKPFLPMKDPVFDETLNDESPDVAFTAANHLYG